MAVRDLAAQLRFPDNATPYYRQLVARDMALRGNNFVVAAVLLKRHGGHPYVWRHNFCQGVEVLIKRLLLYRAFDTYWPQMRTFGHKLVKLCDAAAKKFGVSPPQGELRDELVALSRFYELHWLRYSSGAIAFFDIDAIPYERTLKRVVAVQRLVVRHKVLYREVHNRAT